MSRLSSYLESKQGRAPRIILILLVIIILMGSTLLYHTLDIGRLFEPPYPSDDTPLTLTSSGVIWTMDRDISVDGEFKYANIYFTWGNETSRWAGPLVNDSEQEALSQGIPISIEASYGAQGTTEGVWIQISTIQSELTGDGDFGLGDGVEFAARPTPNSLVAEDEVKIVALIYLGNVTVPLGEYSYVVHNGKFYSWKSSNLDWSRPWYDSFLHD